MNWIRRYPYYSILERQKREIEEIERRRKEEEKAWKAAQRKFKDVVAAEKRYERDMEAEIYEVSLWDVVLLFKTKPMFEDLWKLAKTCSDQRTCYRILAYFRLAGREGDLQLVREAERLGVDVEMVIMLLYQGKREEAVKLLR